jgi:hypothetical protein
VLFGWVLQRYVGVRFFFFQCPLLITYLADGWMTTAFVIVRFIFKSGFGFLANPRTKKLRFWSSGRWVGGFPGFLWWPPAGGWVGIGVRSC